MQKITLSGQNKDGKEFYIIYYPQSDKFYITIHQDQFTQTKITSEHPNYHSILQDCFNPSDVIDFGKHIGSQLFKFQII